MRTYLPLLVIATAATLVSACGRSGLPSSTVTSNGTSQPETISIHDLFIGFRQGSGYAISILQNGTFRYLGQITYQVDDPTDSWVDSHGLYISNYPFSNGYIAEYSSPNGNPFLYSSHMTDPLAVTTDSRGNVYEADADGSINEYAQRKNVVKATCSVASSPSYVTGVAVDRAGDVFASFNYGSAGHIIEITDFASCYGVALGVKLSEPVGIALDTHNNLIVCDAYKGTVDIVKPPYSSVSSHLGSGFKHPIDATINSADNRVWITDVGTDSVYDLYYPSGKPVVRLYTSGDQVLTAVDGSNYVP